MIRSFINGIDPASGNVVTHNIIENGNSTPGTAGIAVDCEFTGDSVAYWKANFTHRPIAVANSRAIIAHNQVTGFSYGFEGDGLADSIISSNRFSGGIRNIIMAHGARGNLIAGNVCTDSISSAIHLAYASTFNKIIGNLVYNTVNNSGEALIQAYGGTSDNTIESNRTIALHATGPQYHIYTGTHVSRTRIANNDCHGTAAKAYIAAESAFNTSSTAAYARGNSNPEVGNSWANSASVDVAIVGNRINGSSVKPALALIQTVDATHGAIALTRPVLKDNVVVGTAYNYQLALNEDNSGSLADAVLKGNAFASGSAAANFVLPRGRAHFAQWGENAVLDSDLQGSAVVDVASIPAASLATVSVTVTGAALGDLLTGWGTSLALPTGVFIIGGVVTAANTVVLSLFNITGGAIDPTSMTYYATVRKRLF